MKKIPWRGICVGSTVMTVLVLARCIATVAREIYYNRTGYMALILQDPWFYVGIAAAAVTGIAAVMCILEHRSASR